MCEMSAELHVRSYAAHMVELKLESRKSVDFCRRLGFSLAGRAGEGSRRGV